MTKVKLKEISLITMGISPKSQFYNTEGIGLPFLQGRTTFGPIYPYYELWTTSWTKEANSGDVLFSVRAPVGDLNISQDHIAIGRGIASIKPTNVSTKYLFYLLMMNKTNFIVSSSGTIFDSINKEALENAELNIHTPDLQQHIVNTIGSVDDLIESYKENIEILETFSLNLFRTYEKEKELLFSDVFETFNGAPFKSKHYILSSNNKLITIKNIDDSGFNTNDVSFLDDKDADKKYLLTIGDIVITMTGNIGRTGIVDESDCYLNQRLLNIKCKSKLYLYCYLMKYKNKIILLGKGTAQLNLSLEELKQLEVLNSKSEINYFSKYDFIFELILINKLKIKKLLKIKDLLLSKYF